MPSGRRITLVSAAVVIAAAAAVVAVALAHGGRATPSAEQSVPGPGRTASPAPRGAQLGPGGSVRPASPARRPALVMTASAAAQPHAATVHAFLVRYFRAINDHDYPAYLRLFSRASRPGLSAAGFRSGFGTTRDSAATLRKLSAAGPGLVAATVTFASRQSPSSAPGHAACLHWRITVYLARTGHRFVVASPPDGYAAQHWSC